ALDDVRAEAALPHAGKGGIRRLREPDDLERPRAIRQAADKAALLQRDDQAVNAGLGAKVERILHLVKGRRDAGFLQPFIDEKQEFELLARQHRVSARWVWVRRDKSRTGPYLFTQCSATVVNFR